MLIGEGYDWREGVEAAWERLAALDPVQISRTAKVSYDESTGEYSLPMFSGRMFLYPDSKIIKGGAGIAARLLDEMPHYSILSALWYLLQAKDIDFSGNLLNPAQTPGGLIFSMGAHRLPLDRVAAKYGENTDGLLERGAGLGGSPIDFGDAAIVLYPFPRLPVVLLVWEKDDEFPARADILFDSTCTEHLPTDILWSTAMMTLLVMVEDQAA